MNYLPKLSDIISTDYLPDSIAGFINQSFFNKLYYQNLIIDKSETIGNKFILIDIVCNEQLKVGIPGTNLNLILNPDISNNRSVISFIISYNPLFG